MLKMRFTNGYTTTTVIVDGRIEGTYSEIPSKDGVYQFAYSSARVHKIGTKLFFISYKTVIGERDIITKEGFFDKDFYSNTTSHHRAKFEHWLANKGFTTKRV